MAKESGAKVIARPVESDEQEISIYVEAETVEEVERIGEAIVNMVRK